MKTSNRSSIIYALFQHSACSKGHPENLPHISTYNSPYVTISYYKTKIEYIKSYKNNVIFSIIKN